MKLYKIFLLTFAMAIVSTCTTRALFPRIPGEIEIIALAPEPDYEMEAANRCIHGGGWASFKMVDPPWPDAERWSTQYLGCNLRFP